MLKNLKIALAEKGWTQKELAEAVGYTESAISLIIAGKREPRIAICFEIKKALNTDKPLEILFAEET